MPPSQDVQAQWPRNYPAIVKQAVNLPAEAKRGDWLAVEVGDQVRCISQIRESDQGPMVVIQYSRNEDGSDGRCGWTMTKVLRIGEKEGPIVGNRLSSPDDRTQLPADGSTSTS